MKPALFALLLFALVVAAPAVSAQAGPEVPPDQCNLIFGLFPYATCVGGYYVFYACAAIFGNTSCSNGTSLR